MRILIVGAAGQLGQDIQKALRWHTVLTPGHAELDIGDATAVMAYVAAHRPDAVVNTAAFHDVPRCEREPEAALRVNALAPQHLARACAAVDARFVHVGTDYVFDGTKGTPYFEDDVPSPVNVYGATKLMGEHLALAEHADTYVVRTTGLFGAAPCRAKPGGRNFVETMLHLATSGKGVQVVADQRCCPTYTVDLAAQLVRLVESDAPPGVYHAVNGPGLSWFDFARLIFATAGLDVQPEPVASAHFPSPVRRPADSRLATGALEATGLLVMRPLEVALADYLAARGTRPGTPGDRLPGRSARPAPALPCQPPELPVRAAWLAV